MSIRTFIQRHSVVTFFSLAFLISYGTFIVVVGPELLRGEGMGPRDTALVIPVIVVGVCLVSIALTSIVEGRSGLRDLFSRAGRWRVSVRWYAVALLTCPILLLAVLLALSSLISPMFTPALTFFPLGIVFGLLSGFLEDIGWTGYAFPRMALKQSALASSLLLGVLWGLWHTPAEAAPHGVYWLSFFLSFVAIVTAVRVLIAWVYSNTSSLLLAQVMHASFSASLLMIAPLHTSLVQEELRYVVYALVLWIVVALVVVRYGKGLMRQPGLVQVTEPASK